MEYRKLTLAALVACTALQTLNAFADSLGIADDVVSAAEAGTSHKAPVYDEPPFLGSVILHEGDSAISLHVDSAHDSLRITDPSGATATEKGTTKSESVEYGFGLGDQQAIHLGGSYLSDGHAVATFGNGQTAYLKSKNILDPFVEYQNAPCNPTSKLRCEASIALMQERTTHGTVIWSTNGQLEYWPTRRWMLGTGLAINIPQAHNYPTILDSDISTAAYIFPHLFVGYAFNDIHYSSTAAVSSLKSYSHSLFINARIQPNLWIYLGESYEYTQSYHVGLATYSEVYQTVERASIWYAF